MRCQFIEAYFKTSTRRQKILFVIVDGGGGIPSTMSNSTLDYPNEVCQSVLVNYELLKCKNGENGEGVKY